MSKKTSRSQQPENSSNVISIEEMAQAQIKADLEKAQDKLVSDNLGLSATVDMLLKELEKKENQILHLEKMLGGQVPIIGDLTMSNEILIVEKQIALMHRNSKDRELTLDEAKRLDIYVRIKNGEKDKEDPEKK
jgi:hypothetical protein